jgi:hypothetical protein
MGPNQGSQTKGPASVRSVRKLTTAAGRTCCLDAEPSRQTHGLVVGRSEGLPEGRIGR